MSSKGAILPRKLLVLATVALVVAAFPVGTAQLGAFDGSVAAAANASAGPDIDVSPTSVDFGTVDVGDTEWALIEVANGGDAPLSVDGTTLEGDDGLRVQRGGGAATLAPGESYTIKLRFEPTEAGSVTGELRIASNDTGASTVTVSIAGSGESTTTPSEPRSIDVDRPEAGNATISISNADADRPVNVTFQDGLGYDGVYLDGLDVEPAHDIDEAELEVSHWRSVPDEATALQLAAGVDRYLSVEKSGIADDDIDAVWFQFRLTDDALGDRAPADVALHRYDGGEWTALPTTYVGELEGGHVFRASSPGFSAFAVGAQEPRFAVNDTDLTPETVSVGENATVNATVENTGDAAGTATIPLAADGETVAERNVTLDAGESTSVEFAVSFDDAGEYDLAVNGTAVGTLTVEAAETSTPDRSSDDSTPTETPTETQTTTEETATETATETTETETETETETTEATATEEPTETATATAVDTAAPTDTTSAPSTDTGTDDEGIPFMAITLLGALVAVIGAAAVYFRTELLGAIGR